MPPETPLVALLKEKIRESPLRAIPFREYMDLCLYHPEYGYYSQPKPKIGKDGDFYTSSSIGPVMGQTLAAFIVHMLPIDRGEPWVLVEWGGGRGRLTKHMLDEIRALAPDRYKLMSCELIEQSGYHRDLQRETLRDHEGKIRFVDGGKWLADADPRYTVIVANELLDAFPVEIVEFEPGGWRQIYVAWDDALGTFKELPVPLTDPDLLRYISRYIESGPHAPRPGQRAEIGLSAAGWLRDAAVRIAAGMIVTIDYGDVAEELYAPHRMRGTLLCYRKHLAYDNPYIFQGEQDITSHVNFSALIQAGEEAGIRHWTFETQKRFLVRAGILDRLQNDASSDPFSAAARSNRAIRQLLWSDGMSELFKVLVQYKGPHAEPGVLDAADRMNVFG